MNTLMGLVGSIQTENAELRVQVGIANICIAELEAQLASWEALGRGLLWVQRPLNASTNGY